MESESQGLSPESAPIVPGPPVEEASDRTLFGSIRAKIISGILLVLPIYITFWIVYWLYSTLQDYVIWPLSRLVVGFFKEQRVEGELHPLFDQFLAPLIALGLVLTALYFLGSYVGQRLRRVVDWFLYKVPVVTTIYNAVSNVFSSLQAGKGGTKRFSRVVLVSFPHPGMRVPGFVTSSCVDIHTGKTILCVYVPTTPVPTSGYLLLVPETEVTDLNWDLDQTLQAVVSGGISVPSQVLYFPHGP